LDVDASEQIITTHPEYAADKAKAEQAAADKAKAEQAARDKKHLRNFMNSAEKEKADKADKDEAERQRRLKPYTENNIGGRTRRKRRRKTKLKRTRVVRKVKR
jgi:hypothetical protein